MKILIDHRERNSLVIAELHELGAEIEVKHLPLADYLINHEIAVERKTVNDFVGSMMNKRLGNQLSDLKRNYPKPLLLIEGIEEDNLYKPSQHPNVNENAIRGMILSIATEFQIPMIFTKNYADTARYLFLLAKRQDKPEREIGLAVKRRVFSLAEQQQRLVEGFPGVGPNLSKNLLRHFKTVKKMINSPVEELKKVPKIGKKKAEAIRNLLESNYKGIKD